MREGIHQLVFSEAKQIGWLDIKRNTGEKSSFKITRDSTACDLTIPVLKILGFFLIVFSEKKTAISRARKRAKTMVSSFQNKRTHT
jgi:hypothetical protein